MVNRDLLGRREPHHLGRGSAAGFRNVVAHGYVNIDPSIVHRAASEGVADLERFAREVAAWSRAQS